VNRVTIFYVKTEPNATFSLSEVIMYYVILIFFVKDFVLLFYEINVKS